MNVDVFESGTDAAQGNTIKSLVLSEHVRLVMKDYFSRLDGHQVSELHAMVISEVERPLIQTVLEHCGYNQSKAAQMLGLSRSTLRKKITQYGLE
ncbi:MAG: DNA-binding protein Fis [Proteobacteria bacterium]|nr:DNA-binding protein Fis [Pseudomonadota bacterium]